VIARLYITCSKYKGYKWEAFKSELSWALVNHINGNAFYNLTHPLLEAIVQQLEDEAGTAANSIPFDYRIAQMVEEVETGEVPMFFTITGNDGALPEDLINVMSAFDLEQLIRETPLMGDYARTNMLPSLIDDDEVVIHGARMFETWDNSMLGVSPCLFRDENILDEILVCLYSFFTLTGNLSSCLRLVSCGIAGHALKS